MTGWAERALRARERDLAAGRLADEVGEPPMDELRLIHAERLLRAALAATSAAEFDEYFKWAVERPWADQEGVEGVRTWWTGLRKAAGEEIALEACRRLVADGLRRARRGDDR